MTIKKISTLIAAIAIIGFVWSCTDDTGDETANENNGASGSGSKADAATDSATKSETVDFEYDVVTFKVGDGDPKEVHINGLPLEEMPGADKVGDNWEAVTRQGVRFSDILNKAGINAPEADSSASDADVGVTDDTPVNCVARDDFDPLRTRLDNDTTKLVKFSFFRDHGYVYVGSPGDKDPLYPEMEGKSLLVDYDVDKDADVPAYLGGTLADIGMFRWKMIEEVEKENVRGIIEIDPVIE
jgi:hypothetical protein